MREHLSCVTRHDVLCESICQGATVPLITSLQTPISDLDMSSTRHNAQAPVPRAGEASQAFVLTAAARPSTGEAVTDSTENAIVPLQCRTLQTQSVTNHTYHSHCNLSGKTPCFRKGSAISIPSPPTLGSNTCLSLIGHSLSLYPFSRQSLLKYSTLSIATNLSNGNSNCPTTNLLVSAYTHSNLWCQELKKLSNPQHWTKTRNAEQGASLAHILCSSWTTNSSTQTT